jgi:hypothetical protein
MFASCNRAVVRSVVSGSVKQRSGRPAVVILYRRAALATEHYRRLFRLAWRSIVAIGWVPRVKKFREELSLACTGHEIRNRHGQALLQLLWFGLVDRAIDYTSHGQRLNFFEGLKVECQ